MNIDLLCRTNDHIRKNPDLHNQSAYAEGVALPSDPWDEEYPAELWAATETDLLAGEVCGTAFCFGGWAALLGGWHQCRDMEHRVVDETGREVTMRTAAIEVLDLTHEQACALFGGLNDLELIDRYVAALVANPDATAEQLKEVEDDYIYDCR